MKLNVIIEVIERCVRSCESKDQLDVCNDMIDNLIVARFNPDDIQQECVRLRDLIASLRGTF
jgi:hypothetical protein